MKLVLRLCLGFDAAPRAGMNYNENSMPTGMESMSENGIQSDGIMDTGEDLDEETDEADFLCEIGNGYFGRYSRKSAKG